MLNRKQEDQNTIPSKIQKYQNILEKISSENKMQRYDQEEEYQIPLEKNNLKLTLYDIITNQQTLEFLEINFTNDRQVKIKDFFKAVCNHYNIVFTNSTQKKLFKTFLREYLSTTDERIVSLNALEVITKEKGLLEFIERLYKQVKIHEQNQQKENINQQIVEEFIAVKQLLNQKQQDLVKEQDQISAQKINLSSVIQQQFELLMKQMEDLFQQKLSQINKRFQVIESQLKTKYKIIENKGQTIQKRNTSNQSEVQKLKAKIFSLEKQIDNYKQKNQELEANLAKEFNLLSTTYKESHQIIKSVKIGQQELIEESINIGQVGDQDIQSTQKQTSKLVKKTKSVSQQQIEEDNIKVIIQLVENLTNAVQIKELNLGEILYPVSSSIIPNIIEVIPIVFLKQTLNEQCFILSNLLLHSALFKYRLNEEKQNLYQLTILKQKNMTPQQHINEVMQGEVYKNFDIFMNPQTLFWKKKIKNLTKNKKQQQSEQLNFTLNLIQNEDIQKEIIQIFKQFLVNSDNFVNRKVRK